MTAPRRTLPALVTHLDNQTWLASPGVGWFQPAQSVVVATTETVLGHLLVLGVSHAITVPPGQSGVVDFSTLADATFTAVSYGMPLGRLRTHEHATTKDAASNAHASTTANVFKAPQSGRIYLRPAPDKPLFASEQTVISRGQVIGLLEVMKSFSRITYDDASLPANVTLTKWLIQSGDDVSRGQPLFEFMP